jgi:hypothetical protein
MKPPGEMKVFKSGAKRETKDGKGRPDLISPIMLHRLAVLMEEGGVVHGDRSWESGMPLSGLLSSASRHLNQTIDGCEDEDHPIQAIWNLMAYVHTLHRVRAGSLPVELDDMPREKNLQGNLTSDKKGSTIKELGTNTAFYDGPSLVRCCPKCYMPIPRCQIEKPMAEFTCICGEKL